MMSAIPPGPAYTPEDVRANIQAAFNKAGGAGAPTISNAQPGKVTLMAGTKMPDGSILQVNTDVDCVRFNCKYDKREYQITVWGNDAARGALCARAGGADEQALDNFARETFNDLGEMHKHNIAAFTRTPDHVQFGTERIDTQKLSLYQETMSKSFAHPDYGTHLSNKLKTEQETVQLHTNVLNAYAKFSDVELAGSNPLTYKDGTGTDQAAAPADLQQMALQAYCTLKYPGKTYVATDDHAKDLADMQSEFRPSKIGTATKAAKSAASIATFGMVEAPQSREQKVESLKKSYEQSNQTELAKTQQELKNYTTFSSGTTGVQYRMALNIIPFCPSAPAQPAAGVHIAAAPAPSSPPKLAFGHTVYTACLGTGKTDEERVLAKCILEYNARVGDIDSRRHNLENALIAVAGRSSVRADLLEGLRVELLRAHRSALEAYANDFNTSSQDLETALGTELEPFYNNPSLGTTIDTADATAALNAAYDAAATKDKCTDPNTQPIIQGHIDRAAALIEVDFI